MNPSIPVRVSFEVMTCREIQTKNGLRHIALGIARSDQFGTMGQLTLFSSYPMAGTYVGDLSLTADGQDGKWTIKDLSQPVRAGLASAPPKVS